MERTNKTPDDCDQLLNEPETSFSSNINIAYNQNSISEDENDIELRKKDNDFTFESPTKRYAEVSQSFPNSCIKRFSDLKLDTLTSILYNGDDESQSLIQEDTHHVIDESRNSILTDTGALGEDECTTSGSTYSGTSSSKVCNISILERLLRTHSLWFLPGIQRSGAVHLLQGKEEGNFIVRGSSQQNTMAISVRLPENVGPYIEHYLIISHNGVLSLENSREKFDSIPALIAHYSCVCEELPVQLCLPKSLREINNRQQLSSLALLGQEWWQSHIASSKHTLSNSQLRSPTDTSSGIGMTVFSSNTDNTMELKENNCLSPMSDTTSSMSSFSLNNTQQILSPISSNSFSCTELSPIIGKTSTFKLPSNTVHKQPLTSSRLSSESSDCTKTSKISNINDFSSIIRPQPPNTLNLNLTRDPPTPPPRLSKISMTPSDSSNFSVTFTFSTQQHEDIRGTNPFPCDVKRLSPEGQCNTINNSCNTQEETKLSNDENNQEPLNKRNRRKHSKHYQEFDILESTSIYCRSGLEEKQSDYEDVWTQNDTINSPIGRNLSSFRTPNVQKNMEDTSSHQDLQSSILTPINVQTTAHTNPFLYKMHQSNNNLCSLNSFDNDNENRSNRFSLDLKLNNDIFDNNKKDWTPFEEIDEANKRTDDTAKCSHLNEKKRPNAFDTWLSNNSSNKTRHRLKNNDHTFEHNKLFLHKLILDKFPEFSYEKFTIVESLGSENIRQSKYDNVDFCRSSDTTSDCTRYSEPWHWESPYQLEDFSSPIFNSKQSSKIQKTATISRNRNKEHNQILIHPQNRSSDVNPGDSVENYIIELAKNTDSTFAKNIENFISCTLESHETTPQVVMRNIRQFMSGMKNYLVKNGEGDLKQEVKNACARLKPNEFLNLDTILENVMHNLVVLPLKEHLYKLFVDFYTNSGDLKLLIDNIKIASERPASDFGIDETKIILPNGSELLQLSILIHRMEEKELPMEKLNTLYTLVSTIFKFSRTSTMNADDFLPVLIYIVAKTGFLSSEIEAEFIWGLINPSLLSGEAGYYLTAICSAVHMLKNFSVDLNQKTNTVSIPTVSSTLKVIIPDEYNGSLQTRTLPIRPNTTVREISKIIAHKARLTNSQDYGLYKLVNGEETLLQENDCPQEVAIHTQKKCVFIFHRLDAKIAWPPLT